MAKQLTDGAAWRKGVQLLVDMMNACDNLDEMSFDSDCREGRPQINVGAWYLRKFRENYDPRVELAFGAALTELVASIVAGSVPDSRWIQRQAGRWPIATVVPTSDPSLMEVADV
jgi:hypothetical protein